MKIFFQIKFKIYHSNLVTDSKKAKLEDFFVLSSVKVEIFLEQREVAFLSPSKIWENLNFSTEIKIFANFDG